MELRIVDAIAPFFIATQPGATVNWSKIPFTSLEKNGRLDPSIAARIESRFQRYVARVSRLGFNALSIDDLAHLAPLGCYTASFAQKIIDYQELYERLFAIAADYQMRVFVTTDVMFYNRHIDAYVKGRDPAIVHLLGRAIRRVCRRWPIVAGVIFRLGESDGVDVEGAFHSRLSIKTARQGRRFIRSLLPLFERYNRLMIIRTWTVGAYPIGDLIWNPRTYRRLLSAIISDHLVVSMKYGTTDFYRFLDCNPLLFEGPHKKILELQARREYEGFGEFPSFIGYDYERLARRLRDCDQLIGVSVWCQTGGWSRFSRLTFLDDSPWNEINAYVTIKLFAEGQTADCAVRGFCQSRMPGCDGAKLQELLRLSEMVMKRGWYIPGFSSRCFFFRRTRVPPLLWIFWDTIIINHALRKILRSFVPDKKEAIREGYRVLSQIKEMRRLAGELGMPLESLDFQYATFKVLAQAREYFLGRWDPRLPNRIERLAREYEERYPAGFHIERDFSPLHIRRSVIRLAVQLLLRNRGPYRFLEQTLLVRLSGWVYPFVKKYHRNRLPDIAQKQTMGFQTLFK
jgi:hypothetical protein